MTEPLRVLIVEDSDTDAKLVGQALRATGRELRIERVQDADAMRDALTRTTFDIVISDYALPNFSAPAALAVLQATQLDLPFIIVSGTVGEETAVEAMRAGAHDYVLKDRLARLAPAVERELREREGREARRVADLALRTQEARFRSLIERSDEGIALADRDAKILYASPGARRILGLGDRELAGVPFSTGVYPEDVERVRACGARVRAVESVSEQLEFRIVRPDGATRWLEATLVNRLEDPSVAAVVANFHDVTERKLALDALRQSETRFRAMIERNEEGISLVARDDSILYRSPAASALLGLPPGDCTGGSVWSRAHPEDKPRVAAELAALLTRPMGMLTTTFRIVRPDQSVRELELSATNMCEETAVGAIVVNFRDITARDAMLAALRESETRFRRLWDSGLVGIAIAEPTGRYLDANEAFLAMVGYTRAEMLAGEMCWREMTPPDWRELNVKAMEDLRLHGTAKPWKKEYFRKDGSRVPVLVGLATLSKTANIALVLDLSAQKAAEAALRDTEGQLRQSQKMEAIGRLAGGIAHDFNNLLSVILSYGEMTLADLKPGDPMRDDIGEICKAGFRAAELTSQLLMFSRQQVLEPKVVDLNEVLTGMDNMLRRVLGEDVDLVSVPTRALARVKVDRSSIEQVVMNLAVNARDAMPTGGQLTIETGETVLDDAFAAAHVGVKPGPHVMLAVTDTGTGMDRATQARIFEPFFTTKGLGKGTGLGLSTVFGIVQQSGGTVWVYSEPGHGTTLKVYLPCTDDEVTSERAVLQTADLRGSETILLVEDEDAVRSVAHGILTRSGYRVIEARNAGEALLHSESHVGEIDLLLTDVVMPQMSGPALATRLAAQRPQMKVICMSGYTDDSVVRHGVLASDLAYLQKPITPDSLRRKVREVLDAPRKTT